MVNIVEEDYSLLKVGRNRLHIEAYVLYFSFVSMCKQSFRFTDSIGLGEIA